MQVTNAQESEKEILRDLVLKEENVIGKLKELVSLSKKFFMIEEKTGNIVLSNDIKLKNKDKITLFLIGRYFAFKLGLIDKQPLTIAELSEQLQIPKTTLSAPLGELVSEVKVRKDQDLSYSIVYHKIEEILKSIQ